KHLVHVALHVAALEYRKPRVVVEGEGPLGVEPRRAESLAVERGLARGRPGHLAQTTQDPVALLVVAPRQRRAPEVQPRSKVALPRASGRAHGARGVDRCGHAASDQLTGAHDGTAAHSLTVRAHRSA